MSNSKPYIGIGLIGLGTVGTATVQILQDLSKQIEQQVGLPVKLVAASSRSDKVVRALGIKRIFTPKWQDVINHSEVDIIVELIGGTTDSYRIAQQTLSAGKSLVTANKALLAAYPAELTKFATTNKVSLAFEAAVGGAIPIIKPLSESLAANKIESIIGIINGTTNYILTAMSQENMNYKTALKSAQKLGYAESNPSADIDGHDAAAKIAILASIAYGVVIQLKDVHTQGISQVSPVDIAFAQELGFEIKLLAIANKAGSKIDIRVHPTLVPQNHALAAVQGVFNAIFVQSNNAGQSMFYGEGAGGNAAASAVVSDIISVARTLANDDKAQPVHLGRGKAKLQTIDELQSVYYLRLTVPDSVGVLGKISSIFAKNNVSIDSALQKSGGPKAELIYITHIAQEKAINKTIAQISAQKLVVGAPVMMRVI